MLSDYRNYIGVLWIFSIIAVFFLAILRHEVQRPPEVVIRPKLFLLDQLIRLVTFLPLDNINPSVVIWVKFCKLLQRLFLRNQFLIVFQNLHKLIFIEELILVLVSLLKDKHLFKCYSLLWSHALEWPVVDIVKETLQILVQVFDGFCRVSPGIAILLLIDSQAQVKRLHKVCGSFNVIFRHFPD